MESSTKLDINDIRKILPHRYPFLLVDRVLHIDPPPPKNMVGRKVVAIKNVTVNEPFFNGHFPQQPIMPGVLIIEALAQTAALLAYRQSSEGETMHTLLASLDKVKFRKPVVPGDRLEFHVEIIKDRGTMFLCGAKALVDGSVVAECEILAVCTFQKEKK